MECGSKTRLARLVGLVAGAAVLGLGCTALAAGPDVIVGELPDVSNNGAVGAFDSFAVGTTSCNKGDTPLNWYTGGTDNRHPVIGQNLFRLHNGRFEQIGQSWLKHGYTALQGNICNLGCNANPNGQRLGVGCSDPYSSGLNNDQARLGPKWEINPSSGLFPYPFNSPGIADNTSRRLRTRIADMDATTYSGARYFVEGHYVCGDDAQSGNKNNNASYAEVTFSGTTEKAMSDTGQTQREKPAILAWKDVDPTVTISTIDIAGDGRYILGAKVTQSGANYTYEYALHNLDSHRSANAFVVPLPSGTSVSALGFHDVEYHSGEPNAVNPSSPASDDWTTSTTSTEVRWNGPAYAGTPPVYTVSPSDPYRVTGFTAGTGNDHTANALRWGTLYNYRFTTTVAPASGRVKIVLFRPGTPTEATITIPTPGGAAFAASTGTCCVGLTCSVTTAAACAGTFKEIGGTCTVDPCNVGTCCVASGACSLTTSTGCGAGTWTGGAVCEPNPCPQPTGACCATNGSCTITSEIACVGAYEGNNVTCAAADCQPLPANDVCATAQGLCDGTAVSFNNNTATTQGSAGCASASGADLWFRYTPSGTSGTVSVTFSTDNSQISGGTTNIDTVLSLFVGSCSGAQVGCDDDSGNSPQNSSRLTVDLTRGTAYFLRVAGYGSNPARGNITVRASGGGGSDCNVVTGACCVGSTCTVTAQASCSGTWTSAATCSAGFCNPVGVCCTAGNCVLVVQTSCNGTWSSGSTCTPNPCPPLNDLCDNRAGLGQGTISFNTTNATDDGPNHAMCQGGTTNQAVNKDIWFNHPATVDGTLHIDTCGSSFDTRVAVYGGTGCADLANRLIACDDDSPCPGGGLNTVSQLDVAIVAGGHYTIRVGGYNNAGGAGQLTLTVTPAATGSCCITDGSCTVTTEAACSAGTWTTGGTCSPNTCIPPVGTCCRGATCSTMLAASCGGPNSAFVESQAACNLPGNNTTPCCKADFNHANGVNIDDIFIYLNAWFASDMSCDITTNGATTPNIDDIFVYLNAWFAGCN